METLQLERARLDDDDGQARHYEGGQEEEREQEQEETNTRRLTLPGNPRLHSDRSTQHLSTRTANHNTNHAAANNNGREDHGNHSAPISREDLRRLRLENRNMHLLLVENRELKKQALQENASAERDRRELAAELCRAKSELERVLRELKAAKDGLLLLQGGVASR